MNVPKTHRLNLWREISILALVLMEVCWVTPWFRSLTTATYAVAELRVFGVLTGVVLLSYLLVRLLAYLRLKRVVRQAIMLVFILIGIFVGIKTLLYPHQSIGFTALLSRPVQSFADLTALIPAEFIVILTIVVAFWRGLSVAQAHIGPTTVKDHFIIGIVMYVLFIFLNTLATGETPADFFFLFLFCSLIAMCAARMTVIGMLRGGTQYNLDRFWLVGMILSAFVVVGLAALFGGLFGTQFGWIAGLLLAIFGSILIVLWLLISPLVSLLITLLGNFLNSQGIKDLGQTFDSLDQLIHGLGKNITDLIRQSAFARFLSHIAPALRTALFIAIILLAILGVFAWMAIGVWKDRQRRQQGEQMLELQSGNLLQRLLDVLRQGWANTVSSITGLIDGNQRRRMRAAARIRQVYADLMELCASLEHPRGEAETPLEFLPELDRLFPGLQLETAVITEAYNCVRYGQLPESSDEVEHIEAAWKKLAGAGHEISAVQKHTQKK